MSGLFGSCHDCYCDPGYSAYIVRGIVGFTEYTLTHSTANPLFYFWAKLYKAASINNSQTASYSASGTVTDGVNTLDISAQATSYGDVYSLGFASLLATNPNIQSESIDGVTNLPSVSTGSWDGSGYYQSSFGGTPAGYPATLACNTPIGFDPIMFEGKILTPTTTATFHDNSCSIINAYLGSSATFSASRTLTSSSPYAVTSSSITESYAGNGTATSTVVNSPLHGGHNSTVTCTSSDSISIDSELTSPVDLSAVVSSVAAKRATALADHTVQDAIAGRNSNYTTGINYGYTFKDWRANQTYPADVSFDSSFIGPSDGVTFYVGSSGPYGVGFTSVPYVAAWLSADDKYSDGNSPTTYFYNEVVTELALQSPYVLATYIMMNDGTLTFDSAVDGSTTGGAVTIDPPDCITFSSGLYGVSGGSLTGPIGRITAIIRGVSTSTWSGAKPA